MLKLKLGTAPAKPATVETPVPAPVATPAPALVIKTPAKPLTLQAPVAKSRSEVAELSMDDMLSMKASDVSLAKSAPPAYGSGALNLPTKTLATPSSEFIKHVDEEIYKIEGMDHDAFISNLFQLSTTLDVTDPELPQYVRMLYKDLMQYPELAHLLSYEQVGYIVGGVLTAKHAFIKTSKPKTKGIGSALDSMTDKDLSELF